jgi:hypothetical protein
MLANSGWVSSLAPWACRNLARYEETSEWFLSRAMFRLLMHTWTMALILSLEGFDIIVDNPPLGCILLVVELILVHKTQTWMRKSGGVAVLVGLFGCKSEDREGRIEEELSRLLLKSKRNHVVSKKDSLEEGRNIFCLLPYNSKAIILE